jgi:general secretion pathway protein J
MRAPRGFTLLEVVVALAIVAAMLLIAFGGLRVALSAWSRGEDRAEAHQQARALASLLARAIESAYPYRISASEAPDPVVQFEGQPDSLSFVTLAAPLPLGPSIAFTAVRLSVDSGDEPGLVIRERALPNRDLFGEAVTVFRDPTVRALTFRYLTPEGSWQDTWDVRDKERLPVAVEATIETSPDGRRAGTLPITVALRAGGALQEGVQ